MPPVWDLHVPGQAVCLPEQPSSPHPVFLIAGAPGATRDTCPEQFQHLRRYALAPPLVPNTARQPDNRWSTDNSERTTYPLSTGDANCSSAWQTFEEPPDPPVETRVPPAD